MKEIKTNEICCKTIKHTMCGVGVISKSKCIRLATHFNGTHYFCKKHSRTGRFIIRNGDIGEIIIRFNTEKELRENIKNYPGMRMQKLTSSHRKDLY